MKDKFEKFIENHSAEFDFQEPSPSLWKGIEKEISGKKGISWRYFLSRAAIVLFIFGISIMVQRLWINEGWSLAGGGQNRNIEIPELKEAEMYYSGLIDARLEEAKALFIEYPLLEKELQTDLSALDSVYQTLKYDLKDNIANHDVIEAMIQNYRLRIGILEDVLSFLDIKKDEENKNIEQI